MVSPLKTVLLLEESLDGHLVIPLLRGHVVNLLLHLPDLSQSNLNIFTWKTKYKYNPPTYFTSRSLHSKGSLERA